MKKYNCIFLDRDGTLNFDPPPGYIKSLKDFKFFDGALVALRQLSEKGNVFCIVSNQSGLSRGLITKKKLESIHNYIAESFREHSIPLLGIYFCEDHPNNPTARRKPNSGMFLEAKADHSLKLEKCLMIGDSDVDIIAGKKLGMDTMLVLTGNGNKTLKLLSKEIKP
jgi:D,D-heptose 1,7-bisphosphate phosphatase